MNAIEKAKRKQNLVHYLRYFAQKDSELDKKARKTEVFEKWKLAALSKKKEKVLSKRNSS